MLFLIPFSCIAIVTGILTILRSVKKHDILFIFLKVFTTCCILLIAIYGIFAGKVTTAIAIGFSIAIAFSVLGDLFLELQKENPTTGTFFFLFAHFSYIFSLSYLMISTNYINILILIISLPVIIIFTTLYFRYLLPHLGPMLIPVLIYSITISTMFILSVLNLSFSLNRIFIFIAAFSFYLSDIFLARRLFLKKETGIHILSLYYFAQLFFVYSLFI